MGDAFITRRGSGVKEGFALIAVTYPVGSTCTCSNGTKTLTAKDTSGAFLFVIPNAGTWVVSCTDGSKTVTKSVVISTQYQSEVVNLAYDLVIWTAGDGLTAFTNLFEKTSPSGSMTESGDNIAVAGTSNLEITGIVNKTGAIVLTAGEYGTLAITGKVLSGYGSLYIEIRETKSGPNIASYSIPSPTYSDTDFATRNFEIPSSMTNCYIRIASINAHTIEISDIRFVR